MIKSNHTQCNLACHTYSQLSIIRYPVEKYVTICSMNINNINFRRDLVLLYYLNSKGRKTTTYFLLNKINKSGNQIGTLCVLYTQTSYSCFITLMMKISLLLCSLRIHRFGLMKNIWTGEKLTQFVSRCYIHIVSIWCGAKLLYKYHSHRPRYNTAK